MDNETITSSTDIFGSMNTGKNAKLLDFFLFIIIIIIFFIIVVPWDSFKLEGMSGGTLSQLMAQDSQDVYLKSNINDLATGNFNLMFNQPTMVANTFLNRGSPLSTFILPDTPMNPNPYPIVASNDYKDYILDKTAKIPNCPYNDIISKSNSSNSPKPKKTFPNPIMNVETKNYEIINGEKSLSSEYLNQSDEVESTIPSKPAKLPNSVPTLGYNTIPSSIPISTVVNSNPYELANVAKQIAVTQKTADNLPKLTEWTPEDILFQSYLNKSINDEDCLKDPASCTGFAGGRRLNDFVQSTKAVNSVNIDGTTFFPDSYLANYVNTNFNGLNIMKPYAFMPNSNLPPNPVKMG